MPSLSATLDRQARTVFTICVLIGYTITFIAALTSRETFYSPVELAWSLAFGLLYLLIGLYENALFSRLPAAWGKLFYFAIQSSLVFAIGMIMGPTGTWLIGLPLAGVAVEKLASAWRWLAYLALIAAIILPMGLRFSTWETALYNALTIGAAILFVSIFTQMRLNEQNERQRAEALAAQLEEANRQLGEYAANAEDLAVIQERNRLAREIHDNLGHTLTIVNVQIEAAKAVMDRDPERALDALSKAQEMTQVGLTRVRESVGALRESPLGGRSLSEAVALLVKETGSAGLVADYKVLGQPRPLGDQADLAIYRAVQEGLTNIRKHARASRVQVDLDFSRSDEICLEIRDNGIGAVKVSGGYGLLGIRERLHLLGGIMRFDTAAGEGFCLRVCLPTPASDKGPPSP